MEIKKETVEQLNSLLALAKKIEETRENARQEVDEQRGGFNIFRAILRTKTELEEIHSNFIAYLLNPNAGHGCADFFIKSFFNFIKAKSSQDKFFSKESGYTSCHVKREHSFEGGRIDIFIEHRDWLVFIENKINSSEIQYFDYSDSKGQIDAYFKYVKGRLGEQNADNHLGIYLTKDGVRPLSICQNEENLICLSYLDIIDWLELVKSKLDNANIELAISQYSVLLKDILNVFKQEEQIIFSNLKEEFMSKEIAKITESHTEMYNTLFEVRVSAYKVIDIFLGSLRTKVSDIFNENEYSSTIDGNLISIKKNGAQSFYVEIANDRGIYDKSGGMYWGINNSQMEKIHFQEDNIGEVNWYRYFEILEFGKNNNSFNKSLAHLINTNDALDTISSRVATNIYSSIEKNVIPRINNL